MTAPQCGHLNDSLGLYCRVRTPFPCFAIALPRFVLQPLHAQTKLLRRLFDSLPST